MPRIQPYQDKTGEYRWRRIAENGNVIADSGEGYKNRADMLDMAEFNFPDDKIDWTQLPSSVNPDTLIDDGDDVEDEAGL